MKSKIKRISKSTMSVILSLCMIMSCMTVGLIATDAAKVDSNPVGADIGSNHEYGFDTLYINASACSNFDTAGFAYSFTANDTGWGTWVGQTATDLGNGYYSFDLSGTGSHEWIRTFRIHSKTGNANASASGALMTPPNNNTYDMIVLDANGDGTWSNYVPVTPAATDVTLTASPSVVESGVSTDITLTASATPAAGATLQYTFYKGSTPLGAAQSGNTFTATAQTLTADTTYKVVVSDSTPATELGDVEATATVSLAHDIYIYGTQFGGWTWNASTPSSTIKKMTYVPSVDAYYYDATIDNPNNNNNPDNNRFRFWDDTDSDTHYHPSSNTQLAVGGAHASASSGSSNYFYTQGVTGDLRFWFSLSNKEAWVENQFDPLNEGFYSLSGNVTDKYIVGSEIVKPKNVDTSTWWSTYHEEMAIDDVVSPAGSGKFKIVFTTTDYAGGINIGLAGKDDVQYAYYYNSTAYNTSLSGGDLDLTTSEMQSAGYIDNVYVYDVDSTNPGGSLKLMPNTTYTITIDQTARLNNSDSNPLGKMKIEWNKVYANAVAMTAEFDKNNRRYNDPEESTTGGTATASPADGNKNELDPTFTATPNSGYTFAGWYSDPECTKLVSADATYNKTNIPVEHTYYALFKQDKPTTEHTVTVTINSAGDYGTITPGPGLEYVDIDESTPGQTTIHFKAYDGATTYITATPNEPTDSAIYELGNVTFSPSGSGTETNGRIDLTNITGDINVTIPFTTRDYYTVTLTGEHGKISAIAYNKNGTQTSSVSATTSGSINVPIGGTVKLTASNPDTNYEFSNFVLVTGEYKRQSDQNAGTSPMTIRPLKDTTAKAKFEEVASATGAWSVDFNNTTNDIQLKKHSGLKVSEFNDDTSADVYYGTYTFTNAGTYNFHVWDTDRDFRYETNQNVVSLDSDSYPKTTVWNSNATNDGQITVSANTKVYVYAKYSNVDSNTPGKKEIKLRFSTTKLHGGGSSIDTTGYRKIYAMDGVEAKTASYGDTVIINPIGLLESDIEDAEGNSEAYVETHTNHNTYFYDPDFEGEITFRVQTTINNHGTNQSNSALGVRGFVYNGKSVEATNKGNGVYYADITIKASDIVDINGRNDVLNDGKYPILEIVPVYYNEKLKDSTDCIKFYVDANSLQNKFGFNLGYYAWYSDNSKLDVDASYPGQPLLKEGTKYYTYIPKKYAANNASSMGNETFAGVLLDNLAENCDVHKEVLKSWGCSTNNDQTFDYEDPKAITDLNANIIEYVVKFNETDSGHQTGTHWYNSQYNKNENLIGKTASDYSHTIPVTKPSGKSRLNGFEQLRDYDNDPVDVYNTKLTAAQNKFDDAVFIVSVGNQHLNPNDWDTVWMVYDHSGNFIEAHNPAYFIGQENKNNSLVGKAAYILYEAFLDGSENHQTYSHGGDTGNSGDRIDGRWLYSRNSDPSNAHIRVATLGKNGDTMNFMTYAAGASGARIAYDDDSCDGITQENANNPYTPSTQEDLYGRWTTFPNRETKAKAVLNQPNGYKIVGFYMQKVGTLGDEDDNYFSNSLADYDEMDRESATVAKFTNSRNNYIVAVVEKVPSSNLHLSHEMYGGVGAHNGAGQFYIKAEVLGPKSGSNRPVIASSGGFVNGSDGYEFEYLNGIARKVSSANEDDHYMVRVTLRTVMAGSNTLYQWYSKDPADASYVEIPDNSPASYGESGTQEKVILVDVNTLYGDKTDTFTYTNLDYYSDIEIPGSIYFKHLKTDTCEGDGDLTAQVKVYKKESNDTYALMDTFNSVNGVVEIPSAKTLQYFNSGDDYYIDSTFTAAPDSSSKYVNTYKDAAGKTEVSPTPTTTTEGVGSVSPKVYPFDNPTANRIPLSSFFKKSGTEQEPAWSFDTTHNTFVFYSEFDRLPEYTANVAIQYFNSSVDTTPKDDTLDTVSSGSDEKMEGQTTGAKVYFDTDPTTTSSTALQGGTFADVDCDDPSPANGYEFIGWYIYDSTVAGNDKYRPVVPTDYAANADKTFVARYRKADTLGSFTVHHTLTSNSTGKGDLYVTVDVLQEGQTEPVWTSGSVKTVAKGSTSEIASVSSEVTAYSGLKQYIKHMPEGSKYTIRVTLSNSNLDTNCVHKGYYSNAEGTTSTTAVTTYDVNSLFESDNTGGYTFSGQSTYNLYSKITQQYTATVKIQYKDDNFDNDWNDESSYTNNVQGDETGAKVYFGTDDTSRTVTVDSGENFNYTKADPNPANGYDFVDWYYYDEDNDSYLKIVTGTAGSGEISETEAKKADADKTFVARYHKNTLNKYEFTYRYKSRHLNSNSTDENDRVYGEQTFTSKGEITAEELAEYFDVDGSTSFKFKDDTVTRSYKQEFIAAKSPYEKNFKEKITWNFSAATVNVVYDSTNKYWTVKTAADVTADYDYDPKLSAKFNLPYDYYDPTTTTSIVPGENDGVVPVTEQATIGGKTTDIVRKIDLEEIQAINISKTAADTDIMRARFLKWVTLNEIKSLEDLNNARATNPNAKALFIKAPESIYDNQNNEYVFRYWSMKDLDEIEYAKCYSNEFNMALYQSSIIEPIYELKTSGNASQLDENAAFDQNNKMATIAFLENSRMQWNENGGGSKISDDLKHYSGDKLVTDFALAFDYQGLELRSKNNYAFGVVVEKLEGGEIDPDNVPTNAQLTEQHKNDDLTAAKNAVQAELVSKIYDNMVEGNKINKSYFSSDNANKYQISSSPTKNTLDNKNELEYYFAMDKFTNSYVDENNHSEGITSTETGLHLNKYRAFSFLMVPCKTPDSETVELKAGTGLYVKFIISDPVYFTNYTEASISNGATN